MWNCSFKCAKCFGAFWNILDKSLPAVLAQVKDSIFVLTLKFDPYPYLGGLLHWSEQIAD